MAPPSNTSPIFASPLREEVIVSLFKTIFFINFQSTPLAFWWIGLPSRTAYALLELSRMAGVSPWVWWGDNVPERKEQLSIKEGFTSMQCPSVERRGIFINDEDWSTLVWSHRSFEPSDYKTGAVKGKRLMQIGVQTYKKIFQLLLRLRGNMIWPAMHEGTVPFYQVEGAMAMADSCGIIDRSCPNTCIASYKWSERRFPTNPW